MQNISLKNVCLTMAVFAATLHTSYANASKQDSGPTGGPTDSLSIVYSETVDCGLIFIDKVFIEQPYLIEATQNTVSVNGTICLEVPKLFSNPPRTRRPRQFFGEYPEYEEDEGHGRRSASRIAEQIVDTLWQSGAVVFNNGVTPSHVVNPDINTFCEVLLSKNRTPEQVSQFALLAGDPRQHDAWKTWLSDFQPTPALQTILQIRVDETDHTLAESERQIAAVQRLDLMSYPLTVLGMLLSVFALGHVLKWTAKSIVAEQNAAYSPEVTRCVEVALLLMLAMSLIDLVWTILAGQAGVMKEVNPLAATYLDSPVQLVAFKVTATGLGCGILYAWRRRKQVQDATWWMCLVCVLLTFRWVVFDSVIG